MKKSLLALAALGAFAGAASAQSSVTLYGTIDLNGRYVKNADVHGRYSLSQDGINSSQLGFRGVEDLGAGLKASFILLAGINADTGTTNSRFFSRRATVSLSGNFGEVRLGRDYTPTFWNNTIFDAFGTNGLGDSSHAQQLGTGTFVRADNSIGYFLPSGLFGGVYGQLMAAAGEDAQQANGTGNPGRYLGGRIGFASGPFDIAFAAAQQRYAGAIVTPGGVVKGTSFNNVQFIDPAARRNDQKTYNIGGSYDFRVAKLLAYYDRDDVGDFKEDRYSVSGVVPMGQGEIHIGYDHSKLKGYGTDSGVSQYALGYVYNLSKRTALYTTYTYIDNDDLSRNSVAGGTVSSPGTSQLALPSAGGKSQGAEIGVRHFF